MRDNSNHIALWPDSHNILPINQTQIWLVNLDLDAELIAELGQTLSPDECARADRFHSATDRSRFIAARGSLRAVLGDALNIAPSVVPLTYTPHKKPVLADENSLRFNVSHSDSLALIAVTQGREIGIDLEYLRTDFDADALAKRFFSPQEYAALSQTPLPEKHPAFLAYWTCKEAYLKAIGSGLNCPLKNFAVSLADFSILLVGPNGDGRKTAPYRLMPFTPSPGYVAALVLEIP